MPKRSVLRFKLRFPTLYLQAKVLIPMARTMNIHFVVTFLHRKYTDKIRYFKSDRTTFQIQCLAKINFNTVLLAILILFSNAFKIKAKAG